MSWFTYQHERGVIYSSTVVKGEIEKVNPPHGKGKLIRWVKKCPEGFFLPYEDDSSLEEVQDITYMKYEKSAADEFSVSADCQIIAQAYSKGMIVVTEEKSRKSQRDIKIPDICKRLGVKTKTFDEMLDSMGLIFAIVQKDRVDYLRG